MRFLVLGSSGQIGLALHNYLEKIGHEVIPYDIVRSSQEDLRCPGSLLDESISRSDYVFFLAFDVGGSTYLAKYQNMFEFINNNSLIMTTVFAALKRYNKKFIFASSQMSSMTFSNYGLLKALGERYTASLDGLVVKFWNVYGIEHDPEKTHVITDFINMASTNRVIKMRTDGNELRQFLYAEDCAEVLAMLAGEHENLSRDVSYDITSFEWISILEIANIIASLYPGCIINRSMNPDLVQQGEKNEPNPYILKYWKPKTSLRDGIISIAKALSNN